MGNLQPTNKNKESLLKREPKQVKSNDERIDTCGNYYQRIKTGTLGLSIDERIKTRKSNDEQTDLWYNPL